MGPQRVKHHVPGVGRWGWGATEILQNWGRGWCEDRESLKEGDKGRQQLERHGRNSCWSCLWWAQPTEAMHSAAHWYLILITLRPKSLTTYKSQWEGSKVFKLIPVHHSWSELFHSFPCSMAEKHLPSLSSSESRYSGINARALLLFVLLLLNGNRSGENRHCVPTDLWLPEQKSYLLQWEHFSIASHGKGHGCSHAT